MKIVELTSLQTQSISDLIDKSSEKSRKFQSFTLPEQNNKKAILRWYENAVDTVSKNIDDCEKLSSINNVCSTGCSHCCNQPIAIIQPEIDNILLKMESFTTSQRQSIKNKAKNIISILEANDVATKYTSLKTMPENQRVSYFEKYFSLDLPCPLLDDENKCLIYSVRPTNCWSYRAYHTTANCKISPLTHNTIKFDDWEKLLLTNFLKISKPKRGKLRYLVEVLASEL